MFISEIFGPTIQGEGRSAGKRVAFLRTFGCNLHCSFCDTAYTWRFNDNHPHSFAPVYNKEKERVELNTEEIVRKIEAMDVREIVITGGEPFLQQSAIWDLILYLDWEFGSRYTYQFETAGTISPMLELVQHPQTIFNVSPKLKNSGNTKKERFNLAVLREFRDLGHKSIFKFVISSSDDFEEIEEVLRDVGIAKSFVWVMLEGETAEKQAEKFPLVDEIIQRGYNFSPRVHTMVWGNKRGV